LYLRDLNTGEEKKIYSYDRHVEVLWSPKGGRLVINDYGGSNYANCIIFIFDPAWDIIDIEQLVRQNLYSNKSIFTNEHVYIVGIEWTREDVVKIKFYGYGSVNPEGFTLWYKYYITGQLKRLSMHP
jgi:hypothetical protein